MNKHFAFLGLLLSLLIGQSSAFAHRNQACVHMADYGACHNDMRMWAYSVYDHRCFVFVYSGCGGNTNRFRTREECRMACGN